MAWQRELSAVDAVRQRIQESRRHRSRSVATAAYIYNLYGFGYIQEMELMREAGFSPLEVIHAATQAGAQALGHEDQVGTVRVGRKADLVIVKGNPIENLKLLFGTGTLKLNDATGQAERVGGDRPTRSRTASSTTREAARELREMVAKQKAERNIPPGPMTIEAVDRLQDLEGGGTNMKITSILGRSCGGPLLIVAGAVALVGANFGGGSDEPAAPTRGSRRCQRRVGMAAEGRWRACRRIRTAIAGRRSSAARRRRDPATGGSRTGRNARRARQDPVRAAVARREDQRADLPRRRSTRWSSTCGTRTTKRRSTATRSSGPSSRRARASPTRPSIARISPAARRAALLRRADRQHARRPQARLHRAAGVGHRPRQHHRAVSEGRREQPAVRAVHEMPAIDPAGRAGAMRAEARSRHRDTSFRRTRSCST